VVISAMMVVAVAKADTSGCSCMRLRWGNCGRCWSEVSALLDVCNSPRVAGGTFFSWRMTDYHAVCMHYLCD